MGKHRDPYPPEFRALLVEPVKGPDGRKRKWRGSSNRRHRRSTTGWHQPDRDTGKRPDGLTTSEREELTRLCRKVPQLEFEREILSKAAAWFARRP